MITIKELSEDIGVSKVGISKWIERNGYKDRLQKIGNKYLLPAEVEQAVRQNFAHRDTKKVEPVQTTNDTGTDITAEIVALLRDQLEAKDKEIERLHKQVDDLQMINADMVKAVRELNTIQAMQLTDGSDRSGREAVEENERSKDEAKRNQQATSQAPAEDHHENEPVRKSFWARLRENFRTHNI